MLPKHLLYMWEGVTVTLVLIQIAESKICLKREIISHRENNYYECNHPVYSECCEHGNQFTCCEPLINKNIREQLQLWGMLALVLAVCFMVYACLFKDTEYISSDTFKLAVGNLGSKFGIRKKKGSNSEASRFGSSDTAQLTSIDSADNRSTAPLVEHC